MYRSEKDEFRKPPLLNFLIQVDACVSAKCTVESIKDVLSARKINALLTSGPLIPNYARQNPLDRSVLIENYLLAMAIAGEVLYLILAPALSLGLREPNAVARLPEPRGGGYNREDRGEQKGNQRDERRRNRERGDREKYVPNQDRGSSSSSEGGDKDRSKTRKCIRPMRLPPLPFSLDNVMCMLSDPTSPDLNLTSCNLSEMLRPIYPALCATGSKDQSAHTTPLLIVSMSTPLCDLTRDVK